jgi:type IV pilus assembly protein PilA
MQGRRVHQGGFTLIELMIVVAIIGILAAIAIPNFLRFQMKAKTSEGKTNLAAIRTAQQSYYSEYGRYVSSTGAAPTLAAIGNSKTMFTPATATGFTTLGWEPDGQVFFSYAVGSDAIGSGFFATAQANIDTDAVSQTWAYNRLGAGGAQMPLAAGSGHACTIGATGLQQNDQVAPCHSSYGQSVF